MVRNFFTDQQIAESKLEWEPQLRSFADSTNAILCNARRLPIYDQAVLHASTWLNETITTRVHLQPHETLIVSGDEHLHEAFTKANVPEGSIFLYRRAWIYWWSHLFHGEAPWWQKISWAINCTERMIELSYPFDNHLKLIPNQTYLCTAEIADRGTHTILEMVDSELKVVEKLCEWINS